MGWSLARAMLLVITLLAQFAAEELLRDGKRTCLSFCLAAPVTRVPLVWGVMKHLSKKIPKSASKKAEMYEYLLEQDKSCQSLPDLPEFQLLLGREREEVDKGVITPHTICDGVSSAG